MKLLDVTAIVDTKPVSATINPAQVGCVLAATVKLHVGRGVTREVNVARVIGAGFNLHVVPSGDDAASEGFDQFDLDAEAVVNQISNRLERCA